MSFGSLVSLSTSSTYLAGTLILPQFELCPWRTSSFQPFLHRKRTYPLTNGVGAGGCCGGVGGTDLMLLRKSSMINCRAIRSNVSEDADEMFDDFFKKYGKVVYRRKDQKPPTAEVDDDAESLSFAVEMAKVASEVKAADIRVLFVKPLVYWTRFFIIATAFSRPQIDAVKTKMGDLAEKKFGKFASGDTKPNSWTLLDYGDVIIHIFLPEQRDFYNLEEFYGNATLVELPFEDERPFGR